MDSGKIYLSTVFFYSHIKLYIIFMRFYKIQITKYKRKEIIIMLMKNLNDLDIMLEVGSEKVKQVLSHILNSPNIHATVDLFGERGVRKNQKSNNLGTKVECLQIDFSYEKMKYRLTLSVDSKNKIVNGKPAYLVVMNIETINDFNYLYTLFGLDKKKEENDDILKDLSTVPKDKMMLNKSDQSIEKAPEINSAKPPAINDEFISKLEYMLKNGMLEIEYGADPSIVTFKSGFRSSDSEYEKEVLFQYDVERKELHSVNKQICTYNTIKMRSSPKEKKEKYYIVYRDSLTEILDSDTSIYDAIEKAKCYAAKTGHTICVVDADDLTKIRYSYKIEGKSENKKMLNDDAVTNIENFLGRRLSEQEKNDFEKQTEENRLKHKTS